jgi:enediyne biosynthesis thioesterase
MSKRSFDTHHVVTFEETNLVGNVYFSNYFSWQGRSRELFLREHAPEVLAELQSGALRLVTAHASCDFADEFTLCDEVTVRMTLLRIIPFGVSLGFEYFRRGAESEVLARGRQDIKFLRRKGAQWDLCELPPLLLETLRGYE